MPAKALEVAWTRQFGSAGQDKAAAVAFTPDGAVLVAGWTALGARESTDALGQTDSFVRRYSADGEVEWARQFGTTESDGVYGAASHGPDVVVAGYCRGALPGQQNQGASDAYVSRLLADGSVAWATQFGSSGYDAAYAVASLPSSELIVVGYVETALPGQTSAGAQDAFFARFDAAGQNVSVTQFGSSRQDVAFAVCGDDDGGWVVAGSTEGTLEGGASQGKEDAFFRRWSNEGQVGIGRQFGGPSKDVATSVACLADGGIVVGGYYYGELEGRPGFGSYDGFVRKYDQAGSVRYDVVVGTVGGDYVFSVAADRKGRVYVAGATEGLLTGEARAGSSDSFLLVLDEEGREVRSWQYGSPELGEARAIALAEGGRVAAVGYSQGALPGQLSSGAVDAYVTVLE